MIICAQALADHCCQPPVLIDAEVAPQIQRTRAEIVRVDQRRQRQDIVAMAIRQGQHFGAVDQRHRCRAYHLGKRSEGLKLPSLWNRRKNPEEECLFARRERATQIHRRIRDAEKRREFRGITSPCIVAERDCLMARTQGPPERIVELGTGH